MKQTIYDCWKCRHHNSGNTYGIDYCERHETRCSFAVDNCDDFEEDPDDLNYYDRKLLNSDYSYMLVFFAVIGILILLIICAIVAWIF